MKFAESHLMLQHIGQLFLFLFLKILKCSDSSLGPLVVEIGITLESQHCRILTFPAFVHELSVTASYYHTVFFKLFLHSLFWMYLSAMLSQQSEITPLELGDDCGIRIMRPHLRWRVFLGLEEIIVLKQ